MVSQELISDKKIVVFRVKDEEYGVDVHEVRSIERIQPITRVPGAPSFVKGVINLRGSVTPIIELRGRLGFESEEYGDQTRIIVVGVDDLEIGLIVDSCNDVVDVPQGAIEPPPSVVGGINASYLDGVAKIDNRLFILLNLSKVLKEEEVVQLEQMES